MQRSVNMLQVDTRPLTHQPLKHLLWCPACGQSWLRPMTNEAWSPKEQAACEVCHYKQPLYDWRDE